MAETQVHLLDVFCFVFLNVWPVIFPGNPKKSTGGFSLFDALEYTHQKKVEIAQTVATQPRQTTLLQQFIKQKAEEGNIVVDPYTCTFNSLNIHESVPKPKFFGNDPLCYNTLYSMCWSSF